MAIVKWKNRSLYDPWEDMKSLQNEINNLFNVDRVPSSSGLFDRNFSPSIDVVESEEGFTVFCELPGLEKENIDVSISSNVLTVKGEKLSNQDKKKGKYYRKESWAGSFQRTLSLPATIDPDGISAELEDGVLQISIPKREEAKTKQIAVNIR